MYCKVHSTLAKAGYACMYVVVLLLRSNSNKQARPSWNLHQFLTHGSSSALSQQGAVHAELLSFVLAAQMSTNPSNANTHQVPVGLDDYVGMRTQLAIAQHGAQTNAQNAAVQSQLPPPPAYAPPRRKRRYGDTPTTTAIRHGPQNGRCSYPHLRKLIKWRATIRV